MANITASLTQVSLHSNQPSAAHCCSQRGLLGSGCTSSRDAAAAFKYFRKHGLHAERASTGSRNEAEGHVIGTEVVMGNNRFVSAAMLHYMLLFSLSYYNKYARDLKVPEEKTKTQSRRTFIHPGHSGFPPKKCFSEAGELW